MKPFPLLVVATMTACVGCSGARKPKDYLSEPSGITLEQAMEQVTDGLQRMVGRRMEAEQAGVYQQLGLHAAEVIICFNVTGSSTAEGKLFVDLAAASGPPDFGAISAGAQASNIETASRGNQITVRFVNLLFATPDTLLGVLDAHDLHRLRYAVAGKDPGPRGMPMEGPPIVGPMPQAAGPGAAPAIPMDTKVLPDLPPISAAASDETAKGAKVADTPEFQDLVKQLKKPDPATQPATQPVGK